MFKYIFRGINRDIYEKTYENRVRQTQKVI